jgi:hypothetical protein
MEPSDKKPSAATNRKSPSDRKSNINIGSRKDVDAPAHSLSYCQLQQRFGMLLRQWRRCPQWNSRLMTESIMNAFHVR